ncbi:MAG: ATP-binding cassette domain-containing protein [Bacteroidales bacterium]
MSEEILKALMQLFAIIAKQDDGVESNEREYVLNFLTQQLNDEAIQEYIALFDKKAGYTGDNNQEEKSKKRKLTSVKDSVRILGLCKKINKTLTQKQKVIVLVRLFELVNADHKFTEQRMAIINTVAEVFKIQLEEYSSIEKFVINNEISEIDDPNILIINDKDKQCEKCKHIKSEALDGNIFVLHVKSVDLYFLRYSGDEEIYLNGLPLNNKRIYLFAQGGSIKLPKGKPIYYSDVVAHYLADTTSLKLSFIAENISYQFPNGAYGLRNINFSESQGKLVGIMGASGAGKTTLMNVLVGNNKPTEGEVRINSIDIHEDNEKIKGVIGYIPQDDLLIEELTVFQNLYYNAKLCFKDKSEDEIVSLVNKTLNNLGLGEIKNLKVGSPLNKLISGGQRKRLNIALELIREPAILFVDEPTSGLSSRDSENVMDLLRELTLKGKLIFVVIHQPSSEIYKMFDNMVILDEGGYMVYYGNPVEGVMYFKKLDAQINSEVGECPTCGNVNPELIFNIMEAKVVDEYGQYTDQRKVSPKKWEEKLHENIPIEEMKQTEEVKESPPSTTKIPNWFSQLKIYTIRDFLSKISNKQYVALTLLEAPILGFILSYIIRYIPDPTSSEYILRVNENIPIYIFMALIVALFLGLTVSAEEIFRDRKILKREQFLNLSKSSYLISKVLILLIISAIQSFLFIMIANNILEIKGMMFPYWLALFITALCANMLGLNISASFNSAVTIYIIIPLLMIPMMILSGAMFPFDKLNRSISSVEKVPLIAEIMPTKWSYEALVVNQYKNNEYRKRFYDLEKLESEANFKQVYFIPELEKILDDIDSNLDQEDNPEIKEQLELDIGLMQNELKREIENTGHNFEHIDQLNPGDINEALIAEVEDYLAMIDSYYSEQFNQSNTQLNNKKSYMLERNAKAFRKLKDDYSNESIQDNVKKVYEKNKIIRDKNKLVQHVDPIYQDPEYNGLLDFRAHFYAPRKQFMGHFFGTFGFNLAVILLMTIILYFTLYYQVLYKLLNLPQKIGVKKLKFLKKQ